MGLGVKALISALLTSVYVSLVSGCGLKDFRYAKELMADAGTASYMVAFFQQHNCSIDASITESCYVHCHTGLQSCVGFAQLGNDCYICDQESNLGDPVPQELQSRYFAWRHHVLGLSVLEVDECASGPCVHGACVDAIAAFTCTCSPGYQGSLCDAEVNECLSAPCVEGTCSDGLNEYVCTCTAGYNGTNCEENINECLSSPCIYGNCTDVVNGYTCACNVGYEGINCQENINDCLGSPCANGNCTDAVNAYTCTCDAGYQGINCDDDINDCLTLPCGHGSCTDAVNGYTCTCNSGYEGINCDGNINECQSSPCVHGSCNDGVNEYTCTCDAGYQGTHCDSVMQCSEEYDLIDGSTYNVGNGAFSASSEYDIDDYYYCASCSRLDAALGWAPTTAAVGDWIKVDLDDIRLVTAVLSQGTGYEGEEEYLEQYTLETSLDDETWTQVQDNSGVEVTFDANTAPDATVTNDMPDTLVARYVRLTVVSYNDHPTLRWEIRGCPLP